MEVEPHTITQSVLESIQRQLKNQEEKTNKLEARVAVLEESGAVKDKIMNDLERFVDEQQVAIARKRDTIHVIMMDYMVHKDQESLEAVLFPPGLFKKKAKVMCDLFDWREDPFSRAEWWSKGLHVK